MTSGRPSSVLIRFAIPVFLGNIFQHFYNITDAVIVGRFIGNEALAAVGSVGNVMFLLNGFLSGMTTGFTVLTAQFFGARDYDRMRRTATSAGMLCLLLTVIISVASIFFMEPLLRLMNTPEDIFQYAYDYIIVIYVCAFAHTAYILLGNILRAMGNSRVPLYFLISAMIMNIILDLLFILVFEMGTRGAAIATVMAQGISAAFCLIYIIRKVPLMRLTRADWRFDYRMAGKQLSLGFPMALQFSVTAFGTILVQSALNILGSATVAAYTAAVKIEQMITQGTLALGVAVNNYCAQNKGAKLYARIRSGMRSALAIGMVYVAVSGLIMWTVGKYGAYLFLSESTPSLLELAEIYLRCNALFLPFLLGIDLYRSSIEGMGYGFLSLFSGIAELIGRGVTAHFAAEYESYFGVCMAGPVAWVLASVLLVVMYLRVMRKSDAVK